MELFGRCSKQLRRPTVLARVVIEAGQAVGALHDQVILLERQHHLPGPADVTQISLDRSDGFLRRRPVQTIGLGGDEAEIIAAVA